MSGTGGQSQLQMQKPCRLPFTCAHPDAKHHVSPLCGIADGAVSQRDLSKYLSILLIDDSGNLS